MKTINLAFVGDTHGQIIPMYDHVLALERRANTVIDGIVQIGDLGMYLPEPDELKTQLQLARFEIRTNFPRLWDGSYVPPIPTWVCPGNHEDWKVLEQLLADPGRIQNFRLLPDGGISDVLGVKVGAIWGNYSFRSYAMPAVVENARRLPKHSRKALHIYKPSVEKLLAAGSFDVLVTHDSAEGYTPIFQRAMDQSLKEQLGMDLDEPTPGGCPGFLELYRSGQPEVHFFGHFHANRVMRRANPRVVCLHSFDRNASASIEVRQYDINEGDLNVPIDTTRSGESIAA